MEEHHDNFSVEKGSAEHHFVPNSAAEFFFCDKLGRLPHTLNAEDVNALYAEYTNVIKSLYRELLKQITPCVQALL